MIQSSAKMNLIRSKSQILGLALALVALCAISVEAQSGRRQPKTTPAAPVPTPTPEPTPEPKAQEKKSELGFILAADRYTSMESYPWSYFDAVMVGCAGRLRSASSATVDIAQNDMNRGEAIKKAKAETTTYVVSIKLKLDQMARSYDDLEVEFTVFAPQTAKVVTFGTAYQNTNRAGPIVVGPRSRGSSGALYREQLLKRAGEDMAERILKALNLSVPVLH
jgi:hypothetical protein